MPEVKIIRIIEHPSYEDDDVRKIAMDGLTNWDFVTDSQLVNLRWYISQQNYKNPGSNTDRYALILKDERDIKDHLKDMKVWLDKADKEKKLHDEREAKRKEKATLRKADKKQKELELLAELKKKYESEEDK